MLINKLNGKQSCLLLFITLGWFIWLPILIGLILVITKILTSPITWYAVLVALLAYITCKYFENKK